MAWEGKYKVIQKNNRILFVYTGWPNFVPEIFAIMVMTNDEFKKTNAEPPSVPDKDILGKK